MYSYVNFKLAILSVDCDVTTVNSAVCRVQKFTNFWFSLNYNKSFLILGTTLKYMDIILL